jgi:hypothetical protein
VLSVPRSHAGILLIKKIRRNVSKLKLTYQFYKKCPAMSTKISLAGNRTSENTKTVDKG